MSRNNAVGDAFTRRWISNTIAGVARFQENRRHVGHVGCDASADQTWMPELTDSEPDAEHVTHETSVDPRLQRLQCIQDTIVSAFKTSVHESRRHEKN